MSLVFYNLSRNECIYFENIVTFSIGFFVPQQNQYDQMAHFSGKSTFVCASTIIRPESRTNGIIQGKNRHFQFGSTLNFKQFTIFHVGRTRCIVTRPVADEANAVSRHQK